MANHSRSTITFQWQPILEKTIIEMEPPFGELGIYGHDLIDISAFCVAT